VGRPLHLRWGQCGHAVVSLGVGHVKEGSLMVEDCQEIKKLMVEGIWAGARDTVDDFVIRSLLAHAA